MPERRDRLDMPASSRRTPTVRVDREAFGRLTERVARFLGTGRYLMIQSLIIIIWIAWNAVAPKHLRFDPYPLAFLTLILSLQAAYSAPLILLAQNRQDDRDRVNLDQDRDQVRQSKADLEYLARELAAVRIALGEVVTRDFLRSELTRDSREAESRSKDRAKSGAKGSGGKAKERKEDASPAASAVAAPAAPAGAPPASPPAATKAAPPAVPPAAPQVDPKAPAPPSSELPQ